MGIWESALILLGIGIVSERFGAGLGLGELGTGIRTLAAAPLGGIGTGLGEFGGGLRTFAEALGDIGRGFGALFENIPQLPPQREEPRLPRTQPPTIFETPTPPLITVSGGDQTTQLPGGGGSVPLPTPYIAPPPPVPAPAPVTSYAQITSIFQSGIPTPIQIQSLIDPQFTTLKAGNLV